MNSTGKIQALLTLTALCLAPRATAQVTPIETDGFLFDDKKLVGFPMPKDWKFVGKQSRAISDRHGGSAIVLGFDADTPNWGDIPVDLWILNGSSPTNRLQALYERDGSTGKLARGDAHEDKYFVSLKPAPHSWYRQAKKPSLTHLLVHRRANGRAMSVAFSIPNEHFEAAHLPLVELATRVRCQMPLWPERAEGYEYVTESGVEIAFLPNIDKKYRKITRKLVKDTVKDFTKLHGKPFLSKQEPLVVYVDRDDTKKGELLHREKPLEQGHMRGMRRMAIPVLADPESYEARHFVGHLYEYLLFTVYPESPRWMMIGEEGLARMKAKCGKGLPYVPKSQHGDLKAVPYPLDKAALIPTPIATYEDGAGLIAFFRLGPPKARKAYAEALKELRTGVDTKGTIDKLVQPYAGKDWQNEIRAVLRKKTKPVKDT